MTKYAYQIENAVALRGSISVGELSELLGVSDQTIRRVIKPLVDEGKVRKVHGAIVSVERPVDAPFHGSVANIFDGCEEDFLRFVHAGLALKFCSSIATTSVSALGPMLKARSTMRASPRMSPVKLKIAAWPLRRARMTSKPLIVA